MDTKYMAIMTLLSVASLLPAVKSRRAARTVKQPVPVRADERRTEERPGRRYAAGHIGAYNAAAAVSGERPGERTVKRPRH